MDQIKELLDKENKSYILMTEDECIMSDDMTYQEMLIYHTALSVSLLLIDIDYSYLELSIQKAKKVAKEEQKNNEKNIRKT